MSQAFPTTRWSSLLADPAAGSEAGRAALESLARRYERPMRAYVRAKTGARDDEARDAVQEFFLWVIESGFLQKADPARGSFRGFVKRSLANFLRDRERRRRTEKRGGGRSPVPLDADGQPLPLPDRGPGPEDVLDDLWRREVLAQAADALEAELRAKGKGVVFELFRDYYLSDDELDYAALAERHGVTRVDVSNHLTRARNRYRAHLRSIVMETVGGDEELRAELAWLFERGERP